MCDDPEFFQVSLRVAARQYQCVECGRFIAIGETHAYVVGKWQGGTP